MNVLVSMSYCESTLVWDAAPHGDSGNSGGAYHKTDYLCSLDPDLWDRAFAHGRRGMGVILPRRHAASGGNRLTNEVQGK